MSDELEPLGAILPDLFGNRAAAVPAKKKQQKRDAAKLTHIRRRLIETAASDDPQTVLYQHTIFCQTGMPYRDPGDQVRVWDRRNGHAALKISAGDVMDPNTENWVEVGLPFGPKPRLILAHLNTEALVTGKAVIETEKSLTAFVSRSLGLDTNGRTIRTIKDQLARLSACSIRLGMVKDGEAVTMKTDIIKSFSVWLEKDPHQRVLWPSVIQLDPAYFESLQKHAVPLDESHLAALSHSALAIDVYCWLAQRLHRVDRNRVAFVSWASAYEQFGVGYDRIRAFRGAFKIALQQVLTVYGKARVGVDHRGLTLWNSPPPVPPKLFPTFLGKPQK